MRGVGILVAVTTILACAGCSPGPSDPATGGAGEGEDIPAVFDETSWSTDLSAERAARDGAFGDPSRSPLTVVAVASLMDRAAAIGSGRAADLHLDGPGVASLHASIAHEPAADGVVRFRIRAIEGEVVLVAAGPDSGPNAESSDEIDDADDNTPPSLEPGENASAEGALLESGARARIGRFIVYPDVLGTFGAVVRARDSTSPAFVTFDGLAYFDPDPAFRVPAEVSPYDDLRPIQVIDTQGWQRPAWAYGEASFSIADQPESVVLWLFTPDPGPEDTFFVAFTDATSGVETYPACRYLSPAFVARGAMVFDFNRATNPSCAYNDGFACPLPPPENRLSVAIRAGEKLYPHAAH